MKQPNQSNVANIAQDKGMQETLALYHAWLAVLLQKLERQEIRVGVKEIKDAIGACRCSVSKEDDCYVIRMGEDGA